MEARSCDMRTSQMPCRHTQLHLCTCSNIQLEPLEGSALTASEGEASSDDSEDVEALSNNTNGVVFFNGGSYSAGPDFIGARWRVACLLQV